MGSLEKVKNKWGQTNDQIHITLDELIKKLQEIMKNIKKKEINSLPSRKHTTRLISQESLLNNVSTGLPSNPNELNFKFNFPTNKRNSEKKPISAKSVSKNTTNKF